MKKKVLIFVINLILMLNVFIILEWLIFACHTKFYSPNPPVSKWSNLYYDHRFEQNLPYDKNKGSILTIGCSFVYGLGVKDNETLAYQLQKSTKRKVYNYGLSGSGIQHVLYKLKYSDVFKKYNINPDYVIYVFITDHIRRLYINYFDLTTHYRYLNYKLKNNQLVPNNLKVVPSDFIKTTFLARKFNEFTIIKKSDDEKWNFFKKHLYAAKDALYKINPNTKFVVVVYNSNLDLHGLKPFHIDKWSELEKDGFIVINFDTDEYDFLTKREYISQEDNVHPSGKAWEALIPVIIKKLNL